MAISKNKRVSLDSEHFEMMRWELDNAIRTAVNAMDTKEIGSGKINLSISLSHLRTYRADAREADGVRSACVPEIKYKLTMNISSKGTTTGVIAGTNDELVKDGKGNYYIISKQEADGQIGMFEEAEE